MYRRLVTAGGARAHASAAGKQAFLLPEKPLALPFVGCAVVVVCGNTGAFGFRWQGVSSYRAKEFNRSP